MYRLYIFLKMYFKVFIFMGYEQEHQQKPSPFSSAHKGKAQGLLIDIVAKMLHLITPHQYHRKYPNQ